MHTKNGCCDYITVCYINVMWCRECKWYYWLKIKKLYLLVNHKHKKIQRKSDFKSKSELILKPDKRFDKTFISACTPKRWCCGYITVVNVLKVCVKNLSITCPEISLLFNFNNL